ncbi:hypothetical protein DL765_006724 [Monosporascus sp. GIB2]|nr:hypothetical protein DL765_006724 [Monosporascus sp. GIB2]
MHSWINTVEDADGTRPTSLPWCGFGQRPSHGFVIGRDGAVSYNGQSTFRQCVTGDADKVNIYTLPRLRQRHPATLTDHSAAPSRVHCGNDRQPAGPAPRHPFRDRLYTTRYNLYAIADAYRDASSAPALLAVSTGPYYPYAGPRELPYQPHRRRLGVPAPDCAHGPRTPGPCCTLFFSFPSAAEINPPSHTFVFTTPPPARPAPAVGFVYLVNPATALVTFNSAPAVISNLGTVALAPRNRYVVSLPASRSPEDHLRRPRARRRRQVLIPNDSNTQHERRIPRHSIRLLTLLVAYADDDPHI